MNKEQNHAILTKLIFSLFLALNSINSYSFEISSYEKKIKTNFQIKTIAEKVTRDYLDKNLRDFLQKSRPSRLVGSSGHKGARDYIEARLKALDSKGASFSKQEFSFDSEAAAKFYTEDFQREVMAKLSKADPNYDKWKGFTVSMLKAIDGVKEIKGVNFVWEKKGSVKPDEVIIIGANYDTLLHDPKTFLVDTKSNMPGADNNASGVIALLSMAEIFNQLDLPKTVRLVFFDFEEFAFSGSKSYVDKMLTTVGNDKISGYVNLVMLGHDSKRDDTEKKYENMKIYLRTPSEKGSQDDLKLANILNGAGKRMYSSIDFKPEANSMNSSSHLSFWNAGIPAVCYSENWESDFNPRFHTPNDFVETLNMSTYVQVFRYITASIMAWNYDVVK
jgi:hypothetical protein